MNLIGGPRCRDFQLGSLPFGADALLAEMLLERANSVRQRTSSARTGIVNRPSFTDACRIAGLLRERAASARCIDLKFPNLHAMLPAMRNPLLVGLRELMRHPRAALQGATLCVVGLSTACAHTETEWRSQTARYDHLAQQHQSQQAELNRLRADVARLTAELNKQGADLKVAQTQAGDLQKTLDVTKEQAALLEKVKASFDNLREKLKELTEIGLEVTIRHNKMVISLPGDVLFASGSDKLSKSGEQALTKVKKVLLSDRGLAERYYQVTGHTDNQPLIRSAEEFKDNWGLSLMRARQVLLYLTNQDAGGSLNIKRWSAGGYAETDPVATNATPEGRRRNRRVELVAQPNVEEMLDLKSLLK
ncbi:MAG: OmpA family protein [Myxococcales bacterium]